MVALLEQPLRDRETLAGLVEGPEPERVVVVDLPRLVVTMSLQLEGQAAWATNILMATSMERAAVDQIYIRRRNSAPF